MCCIIAHRSPPADQQKSASEVETDQPEDPAVGTKRARMMPGSKIVLPSSDADEYTATALRTTVSHIVNPTSKLLIPSPIYSSIQSKKILLTTCRFEGWKRQRNVQEGELSKLVAKRCGVSFVR